MSEEKYKSSMPKVFEEGYKVGKKEAKAALKKHEPKTTRGIVKIKTAMKERLNTEHFMHHLEWKNGFHHGAYDTIMEYQTNMLKKEWE